MTGPVGPQPTATPNTAVCNGDESMSFNPSNPVPGQVVSIQVTSARASTNVSLSGPNSPQFQGSSAGGRGTIWTWSVTAGNPGSYEYAFLISNVQCAQGFLNVGTSPAPTPTPASVCNGDEQLTFNPTNPSVGQQFAIRVTSARPSTNVGLTGPFNPQFQGSAAGGLGTIWTWVATPNQAGSFTFAFTINGVTCASGTIPVNQPAQPTNTPPPPSACTGREVMSFFPNPANVGQQVTVNVNNAAPGITPQLSGPFDPVFEGAGPGGTDYSWRLTPTSPGEQIQFRYVVNEIPCTTGFLNVNQPAAPTPTHTPVPAEPTHTPPPTAAPIRACTGQERMEFSPNPGRVGEPITVNVVNAAPGQQPQLSGPYNPQFLGAGTSGTDYSWRFTPTAPGEGVQFRYVVNEEPCTTGFVNIT
jgi:hypothetical protein